MNRNWTGAGLLAVVLGSALAAAAPASPRNAAAVGTSLVMDGLPVGHLLSDVQVQTAAGLTEKVQFHPRAMGTAFYAKWLTPHLLGQSPLKTVQLVSLDAKGQPLSVVETAGARLQQVDFPLFDATSRSPMLITAIFSAPAFRPLTTIKLEIPPTPRDVAIQENRFQVLIDGLDCSRAVRVEPISVAPLDAVASGLKPSGPVRVSDVVLSLAQTASLPFQQWLASSAKTGRRGSVRMLKADGTLWATLQLNELTITRITTVTRPGSVPQARIEMAVRGIQLLIAP